MRKSCLNGEYSREPLLNKRKHLMKMNQLSKPLTLQEIKVEMESCDGYADIFPEIIKLLNILLVLPLGTASVKGSFSQMKLVKTRLRTRINDHNLARLMRIATEGPELALLILMKFWTLKGGTIPYFPKI